MRTKLFSGAAALSIAAAPGAFAGDWYTGAPMSGQPATFNPMASLDLSLTAASGAQHAVLQGTVAPFGGLEQNGLRIRLGGLLGSYTYTASTPGIGKVRGDQVGGTLLVGHEWIVERTKFGIYGGLDAIDTKLDRFDPENKTPGTTLGFRGVVDFYSTPVRGFMAAGTFSFSSANAAYYMRLKGGVAVYDQVYLGPEILALGDSFYNQWRVGLHVSGVKLGPVQFGASGGYVSDRVRGAGSYGILDVRLTF